MDKTIMDVSRWQGKIDWEKVKASDKVDGVMLRVLGSKNGKPYLDPMFEQNYAACVQQGIPVGKCLAPIGELTPEEKEKLHQVLVDMKLV